METRRSFGGANLMTASTDKCAARHYFQLLFPQTPKGKLIWQARDSQGEMKQKKIQSAGKRARSSVNLSLCEKLRAANFGTAFLALAWREGRATFPRTQGLLLPVSVSGGQMPSSVRRTDGMAHHTLAAAKQLGIISATENQVQRYPGKKTETCEPGRIVYAGVSVLCRAAEQNTPKIVR